MRRMLRTLGPVAALLLLAGCTAAPGSMNQVSPQYGTAAPAVGGPAFDSDGASGGSVDSAGGKGDQPGTSVIQRQVVTTGALTVTVENPVAGADAAARIVESAGGHVGERTERPATDTTKATARLVLRIPADALPGTLDRLKALGEVNSSSQSSSDVTTQVQDVDARITALQTSVDRLLDLMKGAADTADLLKVETTLSQRQAELESLQAQRAYLADQVALSTLTLDLVSEGTVAAAGPGDFWSGLVAGWEALLAATSAALIALGVALPWLGLIGLIGAVVWALTRAARRRKSVAGGQ